ncbi:hypothetical protein EYF80_013018 [Liparis tanakae]|uniref:Uncharacterized protein n=1 Tax=Liparis tanakae TaxID=230148 RepID=A0A4Z2IFE9_9TELE|nr:hypothetical protein EYF80_013018 [Liparis tanakae]
MANKTLLLFEHKIKRHILVLAFNQPYVGLTSLWPFGPFPRRELALITLCSDFGLKAVVLLSSMAQSLTPCHATVCSLISPVHKAPAIHSQHVVSKSVEVPTCPHN